LRSRVIVYAKGKVKPEELSTYEALSDEKWRNRVCIRSSGNIYNQSLIASFIEHKGVAKTEAWMKDFVKNFARPPKGGDRDQIKAVAAGQCDVAVVNSYYFGAMLKSTKADEKAAAEAVSLFWPNQADRGAHFNISGAGVIKTAPNKDNAIKLLEFLTSNASQEWYAEVNNEYPVNSQVKVSDLLKSWGSFKADKIAVEKLGNLNAQAVKAMDRAGWK
jgi:iron(III) transport system substrate-binding protein